MNIELGFGLAIVLAIIGGAVGYGRLNSKVDIQADENSKQWSIIEKLRAWRDEHERSSSDHRLEFERELGRIRELVLTKDGKMDVVLNRLS